MSAILLLVFILAPYAGIAMLITGIMLLIVAWRKQDADAQKNLRTKAVRYLIAGGCCLLIYICFVWWLRAYPPGA